eukprot:9829053-Karenia_brevis.AAC.1
MKESKQKEVDMLKSILEAKEQEVVQMEQHHSDDIKQMDSVIEFLKEQTQAITAAQSPPPPPHAAHTSTLTSDAGIHFAQEHMAQFLQQAKDCIHT